MRFQIILLGLALEIPASITLFFFNDEHSLGEESEALNRPVCVVAYLCFVGVKVPTNLMAPKLH